MIVTPQEWKEVPWRNGRGVSREILTRPDLTLNRTPITHGAPFSSYPGFDRLLAVLSGDLLLTVNGIASRLGPGDLIRFAGEGPTAAEIGGDAVEVFNLIADRTRWKISGVRLTGQTELAARGGLIVAHVAAGTQNVDGLPVLREGDTLMSSTDVRLLSTTGWTVGVQLLPCDVSER